MGFISNSNIISISLKDMHKHRTFVTGGGGGGLVIVNAGMRMRGAETSQIFDESLLIVSISNIISISLKDMQTSHLFFFLEGGGGGKSSHSQCWDEDEGSGNKPDL